MIDKKLIPYGGLRKNHFQVHITECAISFAEMTEKQHNLHRIHLSRTMVL